MIRIAIVGTGNISHAHVEAYLRFPERCKIVALVDIVPEKAQKMKEDYHLTEAEVYDDHQKILSRKDIDLVDVCTPPYVHASISINSLRARTSSAKSRWRHRWKSATKCSAPAMKAARNSRLSPRTASASPSAT